MKLFKQTIMASAMVLASVSAFAQSSQSGVDPTGEGVIHINGTAVGSCAVSSINIAMGEIDFHVAKNGTNGVYEKPIDLAVACSNPSQSWTILPAVSKFVLSDGRVNETDWFLTGTFDNAEIERNQDNFVSVTATTSVPGSIMTLSDAMPGVGTQTIQAKATFGNDLATDATYGSVTSDVTDVAAFLAAQKFGVPTGTINNRGTFSVDVPLVIMY